MDSYSVSPGARETPGLARQAHLPLLFPSRAQDSVCVCFKALRDQLPLQQDGCGNLVRTVLLLPRELHWFFLFLSLKGNGRAFQKHFSPIKRKAELF